MAFRLTPGRSIRRNVRNIGAEQIDRVLPLLAGAGKHAKAAHETRKAMKRLRALLHLVKPAMEKQAFRREEGRLKAIARSLSGIRDIQAMLETMAKLEAYDKPAGAGPVACALKAELETKLAGLQKRQNGGAAAQARKRLGEARKALAQLELETDGFAALAATLEEDYRKARRGFKRAYRLDEDEAFHDWRKYVQRHWRQLILVAPSWPKAMRPHIALARDLSETLGEDHDISVLAALVAEKAERLGGAREVAAYLDLCRKRQAELRELTHDLGKRLLAEKPSSFAARLTAYWETAPRLEKDAAEEPAGANVIPLSR
jgi:hypothetical protein